MRVLCVVGTRPEAIKMAPVIARLRDAPGVETRVLATGQHREMLRDVLRFFDIRPDHDLDVMQADQSPGEVFAAVLGRCDPILADLVPDWVLVQGDTTSVLAVAVGAAYRRIRVGHVEAGLRTYDRLQPFPEELNRVLVDQLSTMHFAPTSAAREALLREGMAEAGIHVTGNTVVDAVRHIVAGLADEDVAAPPDGRRIVLVTAHRRENHGAPLQGILAALRTLAERPDVEVVFPVHPNPNVRGPVHEALGGRQNVRLLEPLDYGRFLQLMRQSYLVLTDSGGIQEEAPSFGVPVLVMRDVTERPEAIEAGVARIVGTDPATIRSAAEALLDDPDAYAAMARRTSPFGDGMAAVRIVAALCAA